MISKIFVGVLLLCLASLSLMYVSLKSTKADLLLSDSALLEQRSVNAKAVTAFEYEINRNTASSGAIIEKLTHEVAQEKKRAESQKMSAERALFDRDAIAIKYSQTANKLSLLLNDNENECINNDLPDDVALWVRTITH